jgi:hypothetical protein
VAQLIKLPTAASSETALRARVAELEEKTARLQHQLGAARLTEAALDYVATRANCLLWYADVRERTDAPGKYLWETRIFDEDAAQRFLPLDVRPGESYLDAWRRSRHPEDRPRMAETTDAALRTRACTYQQVFRCIRHYGAQARGRGAPGLRSPHRNAAPWHSAARLLQRC